MMVSKWETTSAAANAERGRDILGRGRGEREPNEAQLPATGSLIEHLAEVWSLDGTLHGGVV